MIRVLIVDDEKPAREELEYLLKSIPKISIEGTAEDGLTALSLSEQLMPDLVFLDIKMAEMNGFEVAEKLQKNRKIPGIIFTTAYDQFAIKAFEINALDYILKPFVRERIVKSIDRFAAREKPSSELNDSTINELMVKMNEKRTESQYITVRNGDHYRPILMEVIVAVAADGRDVRILTSEGEFRHSKSITLMDEFLDSSLFFRCHRGFIINLKKIKEIDIWFNNTYLLEMKGINEKIPVSRSYISRFRELLSIS